MKTFWKARALVSRYPQGESKTSYQKCGSPLNKGMSLECHLN